MLASPDHAPGAVLTAGLAERAQVVGEVPGGVQGAGVVLAQDAAFPGQGVLVQVPGGLVIAELSGIIPRGMALDFE